MNRFKGLLLGVAFMALPAIAQAQTLNFDDQSVGGCSPGYVGLGNYQGFTWGNFYVLDGTCPQYAGLGYQTGVVSSPNVGFNGFGSTAQMSSATPFTFSSVYATSAFGNSSQTFNGYLGSTLMDTWTGALAVSGPQFLTFNWVGIDRLEFVGNGTQVVLDNLTVNGATVTPEPATLVLLATGLAGIGGIVRRRRQKNS